MQHRRRWIVVIPMVAFPLWSCQTDASPDAYPPPARVEAIAGTELSSVTLTEQAVERLAMELAPVEGINGPEPISSSVPYGAVIYGPDGFTWVYTTSEALTFVRHAVTIEFIDGDYAYLTEGPAVGTRVVSVGGAELFGTEFGGGR